ncbi:MAG: tyrosine-type recombinase/integrase [Methylocella sp.]
MPQGRISKRSVDALVCPLGKDREFLWDDAIAGFGVGAFESGKKVYVAQYRRAGRSHRVTIGAHGRLTPDQARSEAKKLLGSIESGNDPIATRRAERARRTFGNVAEDFMRLHVAAKRKGRTDEEYGRTLRLHILPAIGSKRIVDVTRADVARLHGKLANTPYQANKALAVVSSIWHWAARQGEVEANSNPCRLERYPECGRERFLASDELARLGDVLKEGETVGLQYEVDDAKPNAKHAPKSDKRRVKLDPFAVAAIRLLILTGARLREILDAKWQHVDIERGVIFLADSKTGRKPVYLSAAALEVLAGLPRIAGNPFIIPGAKDGAPRADLKKPWAAVTKAAGLDGLRIHDLRHSFASFGAGASLGLPIIGKLLGHSQAATTHRYAHLDADPMRRAVETIGSIISGAMDRKPSAEITQIRSRG